MRRKNLRHLDYQQPLRPLRDDDSCGRLGIILIAGVVVGFLSLMVLGLVIHFLYPDATL